MCFKFITTNSFNVFFTFSPCKQIRVKRDDYYFKCYSSFSVENSATRPLLLVSLFSSFLFFMRLTNWISFFIIQLSRSNLMLLKSNGRHAIYYLLELNFSYSSNAHYNFVKLYTTTYVRESYSFIYLKCCFPITTLRANKYAKMNTTLYVWCILK